MIPDARKTLPPRKGRTDRSSPSSTAGGPPSSYKVVDTDGDGLARTEKMSNIKTMASEKTAATAAMSTTSTFYSMNMSESQDDENTQCGSQNCDMTGLLGGGLTSRHISQQFSDSAVESEEKLNKKKKKKKKSKDEKKSKKHKKDKKSKRSKKKKKDKLEDETEASVTQKEEAIVDELCNFLSETLASTENQKSFIKMLKEDYQREVTFDGADENPTEPTGSGSNIKTTVPSENGSVGYGMLPSVCSIDMEVDNDESVVTPEPLNQLFQICSKQQDSNSNGWDTVSPPSIAGTCKTTKSETTEETSQTTPEQLFSALPTEFKSYLMQVTLQTVETPSPTKTRPPINEVLATADDHSVASDLTGATGLNSVLQSTPSVRSFHQKPALETFEEVDSESSDSDSDDEDSNETSCKGLDGESSKSHQSSGSDNQKTYILHTRTVPPSAQCVPPQKPCFKKRLRRQPPRKEIRFRFDPNVTVREYQTVLTNNPACMEGPSIGIGWECLAEQMTTLDHMDSLPKHYKNDLILTQRERKAILLKLGYSNQDIAWSIRSVNRARHQRKTTVQNLGTQSLEYAMERMGRSFKKVLMMQSNPTRPRQIPARRGKAAQ